MTTKTNKRRNTLKKTKKLEQNHYIVQGKKTHFFFINAGVRVSLRVPRLISYALKLTTM